MATLEKLVWGDQYKLGFKQIDDQHKELVRMLGELTDVVKEIRSKSTLERIFYNLIDYTLVHFTMEESLMQTYAFPGEKGHIQAHTHLKKVVVDLQNDYMSGKVGITLETIVFLNEWLSNHILITDKHLADFLNAKGIPNE